MSFFEFPHTRTYDSDLGFIIRWIKEILPQIDDLETWKTTHEEEYNELLYRVDHIGDIVPSVVQNELMAMIEAGTFQNLIEAVVTYVTENYIGSIFDTTVIDALQTTTGEYIYTTTGELIIVSRTGRPTAFTTNEVSNFYDAVKEKTNEVKEGKKPINTGSWAWRNEPPVLTLLHISDYHGDEDELKYIYNDWTDVLALADDYICTGDFVKERFSNPFLYYPTTDNALAKETMLVIGNHDALADPTGWDFTILATQDQQYNKFFAPTIAYWGVIHSGNNTYYYKDYTTQGIRLIVLNDMLENADMYAQLYWLENTALQTNMSVVIAKHYMPPTPVKIPSAFTSIDNTSSGHGSAEIPNVVQRFINNGGKFICYICGHSHYDYIGYLQDHPAQICIAMDATGREACNQWSDVMRYNDEISRDLFNMVQFDTSNKLIKLIRCGCNYDRYLRHKNTLSISYETKEIFAQ